MFENIKIPNNPNQELGRNRRREEFSRSQKNEGESLLDRRSLLKAGLAMATVYGIGDSLVGLLERESAEDEKDDKEEVFRESSEGLPTEEQLKIEDDDKIAIGDTIKHQLEKGGEIKLDMSTKKALYVSWMQKYRKRPEGWPEMDKWTGSNHLGLLQSMEKMQPWIGLIKEEFAKIGVPEKYAYLAIPESHFDISANSRARAGGPYQFTAGTAEGYGLAVGGGIDERRDPIESARACAEHLKYSYERFNNDWDLAFSDYNGGFTQEYEKFRPKKEDRNYQDYLAWREGRLNEFVSRDHYEHEVTSNDGNLGNIAGYYGLSTDELLNINGLTNDQIKIGQVLKLPDTVSVKLFKLRDSLENLNYPEKFYAVLDVIEEEELEKKFPARPLSFYEKRIPKVSTEEFSHIIKKGEGLFGIARKIQARTMERGSKVKFSASKIQKLIETQNGIFNSRTIRPGKELKVELPLEEGISLAKIAVTNKIPIEKLIEINPSIIDRNIILEEGIKIRIPR